MIDYKEAADRLLGYDQILIYSHVQPDGDTLGSGAALCRALRQCGKTAYICQNACITEQMMPYVQEYIEPSGFQPNVRIAVDVADRSRLIKDKDELFEMMIDHHPTNGGYGRFNYIDPSMGATGEIIAEILSYFPVSFDAQTATLLYIAVATDTGCFQYSCTTPHSFRTGALLLEHGAENVKINNEFFRKITKQRAALEGMILTGIEYILDGRVALATVTREMIQESGASLTDQDNLSAIISRISGGDVSITFTEESDNSTRVSIRSTERMDSDKLATRIGGGGHNRAAGAHLPLPLKEAKLLVVEKLKEELES